MNAEEKQKIQALLRASPKTIWGYWPFLLPVILVVAGTVLQVVLLEYFKRKVPDLEILLKSGQTVEPVMDSELTKQVVLAASACIAVTGVLFIYVATQSHKCVRLLKTAAKDLRIDAG